MASHKACKMLHVGAFALALGRTSSGVLDRLDAPSVTQPVCLQALHRRFCEEPSKKYTDDGCERML